MRALMRMMCFKERSFKEAGQGTHERVPEAVGMNAVPHFFSENVCRICLASDMLDGYCFVLNPFVNGVFAQFNVPSCLRYHVGGPLDTGFIVIVNKGRLIQIQNRKTKIGNTLKIIT